MIDSSLKPKFVPRYFTNRFNMAFKWVDAGSFWMGSDDSDDEAYDDEKPRHRVTLTRGFYLGIYAMTQEEWAVFMTKDPRVHKGDRRPAVNISWDDIQAFLFKINRVDRSHRYRLPTEAEWEYACRAGTETRRYYGDDVERLGEYAWYSENSGNQVHPVGEKKPNAWGFYDMLGNVWEWCNDYWFDRYSEDSVVDPLGPETGASRVDRGGSWLNAAWSCRCADRDTDYPATRHDNIGFRLACVPQFIGSSLGTGMGS